MSLKSTVYINKDKFERKMMIKQFCDSFYHIGLDTDFSKASSVFIKPNLTYPNYKRGVTTRKEFIETLIEALREINSSTKIFIGESEGGYNSFSMTEALRVMGYYEISQRYPNIEIINLSKLPSRKVELTAINRPYLLDLPELFFNEISFSITCPLPKVHCMTKITLSFKNQWGFLPDIMRLKNHYVFDEIIGQICELLKFRYAFLDGRYGLDSNGPMDGDPVDLNWFVAANSLGAFDVIVSEMMGFDWRKIGHLRGAAKLGLIPQKKDIMIHGDIGSLKNDFKLSRTFWNYPALTAFHSKRLTHLFYLSNWSDLLHRIMYTFRKRPVQK